MSVSKSPSTSKTVAHTPKPVSERGLVEKPQSSVSEARPEDVTIVPKSGSLPLIPGLMDQDDSHSPLILNESDLLVPDPELQSPRTERIAISVKSVKYPKMPGYEILGELGRGGMGVVYRAKQLRLNRIVALKMLLHSDNADMSDVIRFRSEAEAVASVKHPHVVQVHEFGQHDGKPYFTMEYLCGGTLHHRIRQSAPFNTREAAALIEKLARAVHAAHNQGIVHRDIKPGNILFDSNGEPRVGDFGLAKRVSQNVTQTQAVMGTPAYMPPEQAAGKAKHVGPPADIYALGVILYECLMGKPPFESAESLNVLHQVIHDPPPPMRTRRSRICRDLELICMKCLEKEPTDRYSSAAALADDLQKYLNREPVSVRPAGKIERTHKWIKRHPTLALAHALATLVLILTCFVGGATFLWQKAAKARDEANTHYIDASSAKEAFAKQKKSAEAARDELANKNKQIEKSKKDLESALSGQQEAYKKLESTREDARVLTYFRDVAYAQKELKDGNFLRAIQLLEECPTDLRCWEWWHVYKAAHPEFGCGITNATPFDISFDPINSQDIIAAYPTGAITRYDFSKGSSQYHQIHNEPFVSKMLLSSDGRRALIVKHENKAHDDAISVWDLQSNIKLCSWSGPHSPSLVAGFSGDGTRVVVGYQGQPVRAFDVPGSRELPTPKEKLVHVSRCILSTTGEIGVVVAENDFYVWDVTTGETKKRFPFEFGIGTVTAIGPDENTIALGSANGAIQLVKLNSPKSATTLNLVKAHLGPILALAFNPEGTLLASASEDGCVRVWDVETGKLKREYYGHTRSVNALRFNKTGEFVASCDNALMFKMWPIKFDVSPVREMQLPKELQTDGYEYFTDAESKRVFMITSKSEIPCRLWLSAQSRQMPFPQPKGLIYTTAGFHPTQDDLLIGTNQGHIVMWNKFPSPGAGIHQMPGPIVKIEYSKDGSRILVASPGFVRILDSKTFQPIFECNILFEYANISLSPDGNLIAGVHSFYCTVVNIANKSPQTFAQKDKLSMVSFSPDSSNLILGTRSWQILFYDTKSYVEPVKVFNGHVSAVRSIAYSPDGTRMATGSEDGAIVVWDTKTGNLAVSLNAPRKEPITRLQFMPNMGWQAFQPGYRPTVFDGSPGKLALQPPKIVLRNAQ